MNDKVDDKNIKTEVKSTIPGAYSGKPGIAPRPFSFANPPESALKRAVVPIVKTDILVGNVQIINQGGERQLHSHTGMDGFWMVLKGRVRFYGPEDETVIKECGPMEGVFVPRNVSYWFESVGEEQAHLLQVEAIDKTVENKFIAHGPRRPESGPAPRVQLRDDPAS
jgi:mannose-6-phosphate isomerase-like protein (cupin superfamily)